MVNAQNSFTNTQLKFERVANAYQQKWPELKKNFHEQGFKNEYEMLINAYKTEGTLEVWLKTKSDKHYKLFRSYNFCAHSGVLGPKLYEGDKQTPEGFYSINVFNPMSTYYLSLGINYPNPIDILRTGKNRSPGSDIYIHGNCVTVGCIPLTDEKIKEVYLLAMFSANADKNNIPVHIYPFKMTEANFKNYSILFPEQMSFWRNLQKVYQSFEKKKTLPKISYSASGYVID